MWWGILQQCYHHDLEKHGMIFHAIAVMTQLDIDNGNCLFLYVMSTQSTRKNTKRFQRQSVVVVVVICCQF
jgi:hypothetical protein